MLTNLSLNILIAVSLIRTPVEVYWIPEFLGREEGIQIPSEFSIVFRLVPSNRIIDLRHDNNLQPLATAPQIV